MSRTYCLICRLFLFVLLVAMQPPAYGEEVKIGDDISVTGTVIADEIDSKGRIVGISLLTKNGPYRIKGRDYLNRLSAVMDRIIRLTGKIDVDENGNRVIFVQDIHPME